MVLNISMITANTLPFGCKGYLLGMSGREWEIPAKKKKSQLEALNNRILVPCLTQQIINYAINNFFFHTFNPYFVCYTSMLCTIFY